MWTAAARPLPFATLTAGKVVMTGRARLRGWTVVETTGGASAALDLYDGGDSGGILITPITLSSGQSTRDWISSPGIEIEAGLVVNVTSGSVRGVLWVQYPELVDLDIAAVGAG